MQTILSVAIVVVLVSTLLVILRYGTARVQGSMPSSLFAFVAILFTSGLDVGLIMFPLTEFPVYQSEAAYSFTNALAIEFGFWGFLIWAFYFLTTFYFCVIEPKLKLFEIPVIHVLNNLVIVATCAFTGFLFLSYLPSYVEGITPLLRYGLVALVVMLAVFSSTDIRYVKILSVSSTWLFFVLILAMFLSSGMGMPDVLESAGLLGGYFSNIDQFIFPLSDYHAFYLFWWFSWSIMIGQFVARFVGDMPVWQLLLALLIFPSIPIAIWFSVLYFVHTNSIELGVLHKAAMVTVGVVFVVNSLDSLTRLYSENLQLSVAKLGRLRYVILHFSLLSGLIVLYQFTPLKIEWIGLLVILIYALIYGLVVKRLRRI